MTPSLYVVPYANDSGFSPAGQNSRFLENFQTSRAYISASTYRIGAYYSKAIEGKSPLSNETTSSTVALLEKVDTLLQKLKTPFLAIFGPIWGILTLILRADPGQVGVSTQGLIEFYHHAKFQLDPSTQ